MEKENKQILGCKHHAWSNLQQQSNVVYITIETLQAYTSTVQPTGRVQCHGKICEKWVYISWGVFEKLRTFSPINTWTFTFQSSFIVQPSSSERLHSPSPVRMTRSFLNFTLDLILYYEEPSVYLQSPLKPPFTSKLDWSGPGI